MRSAFDLAVKHAKNRKQFNQPLNSFGLIQEKIAKMAADIYAVESLNFYVSSRVDQGQENYAMESAICKVFSSEKMWSTVDRALQVAGGIGYMQEYPYEKLMRDARINLIFEGSNEILRIFIALSGMRGPGESLRGVGHLSSDTGRALLNPIKSFGLLGSIAKNRLGKMIPKTLSKCHPNLKEHGHNLSKMVSSFAIEVENSLIKYGSKITKRELVQKRIADMATALTVMSCVLSRSTSILNDDKKSDKDKKYIEELTDVVFQDQGLVFKSSLKETSSNLDTHMRTITEVVSEAEDANCDLI